MPTLRSSSSSNSRAKLILSLIPPISIVVVFSLLLLFSAAPKPTLFKAVGGHRRLQAETAAGIAARHCDGTLYPELCVSTLATFPSLATKTLPEVISALVNRTAAEVRSSSRNCSAILEKRFRRLDPRERLALGDCLELLDATLDAFRTAERDLRNASYHTDELRTLLSAAMTNQYTCLDGFAYVPGGGARRFIEGRLRRIDKLVSNSLAMARKIERRAHKKKKPRRPHESLDGYGSVRGGFPEWVSAGDRRLLQTAANATKADIVVAKDGSGNFTTVGEAVAAAPNNTNTRFVIYIKGGAYFENVEVGKSKKNIMFLGDGIGKTVIKASRNVIDGWTTFRSATVAVVGDGFLAKGITIENAAGAVKHQAVALRVGADLSAFYKCSFVGYQDTLYVHSLRQFFRECDIYGTVDFIFGNSAVVFQNCNLYARKPLDNEKNIFTAQGREDQFQNTGISIQNCKVAAAADLIPVQSTFKTFLGRPWKEYSRTIFMQSYLDSLIDPAGWLEWNGTFALSTLYYREYKNRGPGSNTTSRVSWPGYKATNNATEASQFTVESFIQGDEWLGPTSIPFVSGLF